MAKTTDKTKSDGTDQTAEPQGTTAPTAKPENNGPTEQPEDTAVRVMRALPNPATQHNGVTFATVKLGERQAHVSERITPEQAKRFCRVSGYSLFDGDEVEYGRVIEDALDAARKVPSASGKTPADAGFAVQLAEQHRINQRQSEEIGKLRATNQTLTERNRALEDENRALKESGAKVAG